MPLWVLGSVGHNGAFDGHDLFELILRDVGPAQVSVAQVGIP